MHGGGLAGTSNNLHVKCGPGRSVHSGLHFLCEHVGGRSQASVKGAFDRGSVKLGCMVFRGEVSSCSGGNAERRRCAVHFSTSLECGKRTGGLMRFKVLTLHLATSFDPERVPTGCSCPQTDGSRTEESLGKTRAHH